MTRTLTLACIVSLVSSLHGQSLADVARNEEKRGAATAARTSEPKVYTKKDIDALPPEVVTSPNTAPSTEESAAAPAAPESIDRAEPAKDETYWKRRMAPLRANLERDQRAASIVRADLRTVEVHLQPTQWSFSMYGGEWLRLTKEMSDWDAIIRQDEKTISDLEEEGRVAGALPGWLR